MASKEKEVLTTEQLRAKLLFARAETLKAFEAARDEYNLFCKENPVQLAKQPSVHELRLMRDKIGETSSLEHAKVNAAQASKVARDNLIKSVKA